MLNVPRRWASLRSARVALAISAVYAVSGAAWVVVAHNLLADRSTESRAVLDADTLADWLFVFVSALILLWLIRRSLDNEHRAGETLRASHERFVKAFHTSPDAININRLHDGLYLDVNEGFTALTGYTPPEVIGRSSLDLNIWAHPDDRAQLVEQIQREGRAAIQAEFRIKDGSIRIGALSARLIDVDGEACLLSITRDITDTQRAEQAEREQRALAEALRDTAAALNGTLQLDQVLDRILANIGRVVPHESASIMLLDDSGGVSIVRSHGYRERGMDEQMSVFRSDMRSLMTLRRMAEAQQPIVVPDTQADPDWRVVSETHWIRSYAGAPIFAKGRLIGFLNVDSAVPSFFNAAHAWHLQAFADQAALAIENARLYRDSLHYGEALEERVAERTAELARERERLQTILDAAGEGISFSNSRMIVEYVNPVMQQLTGYTALETLGQLPVWRSGLTPESVYEDMQRVLERGEMWRGEVVNRRKDGHLYNALLTLTPLKDAGGVTIGYVGIQRDVTQQKEIDRLKDQFVSNVSHELRTPLANIKLYLSLLDHGRADKRQQYMQTLHRETARLEELIVDLLDLSRIQLGAVAIRLAPTDLNQSIAQMVADRSALAAQRSLSLDYQPDPALPKALIDPILIGQVISNLMSNAINYTPTGGLITVVTAARQVDDGGWVTFSVQDTGPGITPDETPRLFERFYRGQAGRLSGMPGTGLGLTICKEIVERMNGRITVDSEPGHGAAFTVWLKPMADLGT